MPLTAANDVVAGERVHAGREVAPQGDAERHRLEPLRVRLLQRPLHRAAGQPQQFLARRVAGEVSDVGLDPLGGDRGRRVVGLGREGEQRDVKDRQQTVGSGECPQWRSARKT
jgi:hypothetical protein